MPNIMPVTGPVIQRETNPPLVVIGRVENYLNTSAANQGYHGVHNRVPWRDSP